MSVLESLNETSNKAVNLGEEYLTKTQEYYELKVFQQLTATVVMFCKARGKSRSMQARVMFSSSSISSSSSRH